ncbi:MAG: polyphosphate kinase 1 [Bacteroidota bacterium]|nr:polyphosphate kinase 1 [Bacteroidota bacterium]
MSIPFVNREISWLDFNQRVLQEAQDKNVPLIERIRFIGIFSNNLDEFFKVRYATVKRVAQIQDEIEESKKAEKLLNQITEKTIKLQQESFETFEKIIKELENENIFFCDELNIEKNQKQFIEDYFEKKIYPFLQVIIVNENTQILSKTTNNVFLVSKIIDDENKITHGLIEIPSQLDRIIVLPSRGDKINLIMLDDLIRHQSYKIFMNFSPKEIKIHMIKFTRDAELDFDDDINKSYVDKIAASVKDRDDGDPVRFDYDKEIDDDTLEMLLEKFNIGSRDSIIAGGKYQNRKDYINFPSLDRNDLLYDNLKPLKIHNFNLNESLIEQIDKKDYLQYTPYHKFDYIINFLREVSVDKDVKTIFITIYRLSEISQVANLLIQAARNGKRVTVQIELQARFDEEANIRYAEVFKKEGVRLIFGIPNLKVHSKICVIQKKVSNKLKRYGFISTGNFNESTARLYTDFTLFTSNQQILKEVLRVFTFLEMNYKYPNHKLILISPYSTSTGIISRINREIENAKNGKNALIRVKINNLTNIKIVEALYRASQNGVQIRMIIRGVCCLVPGVKGFSDNIQVISVIDRFLEHPRLVIFENCGQREIFISSSDWMTRNLDNRVEVSCPIYDKQLQQEIIDTFEISWHDNIKSRNVNHEINNQYRKYGVKDIRSQYAIYKYYQDKVI